MRKFFKPLLAPIAVLSIVLAHAVYMTGCTDVDDTLGQDLIPDGMKMLVGTDTLTNIRTYVGFSDSIFSNYRSQILIGSKEDPVFGRTVCGSIAMIYPYEADFNEGRLFGNKPHPDSVKMTLLVDNYWGKEDVEQTFYIYALRDSLDRDSIYYPSFPIEKIVDFDKPLYSFTMSNETTLSVKLLDVIGQDGWDYLQKLADIDSAVYAAPYYSFRKHVNGFYIAPAPDSPSDAAVYRLKMYDDTNTAYTMFTMYAHNYQYSNPSQVQDTMYVRYVLDDEYPIPNMTVNKITHTYPQEIQDVINDTTTIQSKIYAQGLDGLATRVTFGEDFWKSIDDLRTHTDRNGKTTQYRSILINQAMLYIPISERTADKMDDAPSRLGIYMNYTASYLDRTVESLQRLLTSNPTPVVDYQYILEDWYGSSIPYGGYLNRSNGYYAMNISIYVSRMLEDKESVPMDLWIGPGRSLIAESYSQIELNGNGASDPIKLVLTYTLVK